MSQQYRVVSANFTHTFAKDQVITRLPDSSEQFQFVLKMAEALGITDAVKETDSHAYIAADGDIQVLEGKEVEAL